MERIKKENIIRTKLYIGPMSKNIVDAIINYNTNIKNSVGIIASRRQIDYFGGYVNNWTTHSFVEYVKSQNPNIIVCRDHGGIDQGIDWDDGVASFLVDAKYMDVIHIDPFKKIDIIDPIEYTITIIKKCMEINENCYFEIGTEQSIHPIESPWLDFFLHELKLNVPQYFSRITYAVIQSGTSLKSGINTGEFNRTRLLTMIDICNHYGVLSKEHNGDYLTPQKIEDKFKLGLSAINIAPEVAHIETEYIMEKISKSNIDKWFNLCLQDGKWKKWFPDDFDPYSDIYKVIKLCGHYVLTYPQFIDIFDLELASEYVNKQIHNFINERIPNYS
jgi:hypothetical protein